MTGPTKNVWDKFQTVGEQRGERRRQGSWGGWIGLVLLCSILGFLIFPLVILLISLTFFSAYFSIGIHGLEFNYGALLLRAILEGRSGRERMQVLGLLTFVFVLVGGGLLIGLRVGHEVSPTAGWLTCIGLVNLGVTIAIVSLERLRQRHEEREERERQKKREKIRQIREEIFGQAMSSTAGQEGQE